MDSVALSNGPIHLGLDVSKNNIAVGILLWDEQAPDTEMLFNDEPSVRRLINRFVDPGGLRVCYEAGPTGFGLYRLVRSRPRRRSGTCAGPAPRWWATVPGSGT